MRPRLAAVGRHRREHVRLRRRRNAARLDSGRAEPRAGDRGGHVAVDPQGDDRDRGSPLLRARRRRRRGNRACSGREPPRRRDRRGRVDDHAAARAEPLHLAGADRSAQGEGGVPRDEARPRADEAVDPDLLPEPELLRQSRVRHRGGRADLLLEAGQGPHAVRVGAARGPAAGAVDLRPVHGSRARARATAGGAAGDAGHGRHHAAHLPQGRGRAARASTRPALRRDPRAVLLRLRP